MHRTYAVATHSGESLSVVCLFFFFCISFFTFLCMCTFTRYVHMVLLFLISSHVRDGTRNPHLINSTFIQPNKHEMQNSLNKKSVTGRMPASKHHCLPSFRHARGACLLGIMNLSDQTRDAHSSEIWAQLVHWILHISIYAHCIFNTTMHHSWPVRLQAISWWLCRGWSAHTMFAKHFSSLTKTCFP